MAQSSTPSLLSRLVRRVLIALYRARGWQIEGRHPGVAKSVMLGVPHTTNWDFVFFLGAVDELGIRPSFIGKHTLFRWPLTRFMRDMGGLSVDRSRPGSNIVDQVAEAFAQADEMALVVAPEGTRGAVTEWRSGFYHIARAAGVPIVPGWVDHERRRGGIGPAIPATGDFAADLRTIAEFYFSKLPHHPKLAALYAQAGLMPPQAKAIA